MAFNAYMHERNIYRNQPNFAKIALDFPEFRKYAIPDAKGQKVRVDFTNTEALRMLTKILLKKDFNLDVEIPEGFLIPTIPQRLNYILWLEDLLSNIVQKKEYISGIDIGTGPCAIFSVLGARKNGWKFVATESSDDAVQWAKKNIEKNNLLNNITVVKVNQGSTLDEILSSSHDCYDFCLCNPPFFENIEEIRKKHQSSNETIADVAQKEEIFVKGGELDFVTNILKESLIYKDRICLFTSMFGKKKSFLQILQDIKEIKDAKFTTTEFCQGNTIRWGIAWTFSDSIQFEQEVKKRLKPKKAKPPLEYQILLKNSKNFHLDTVVKQVENYLKTLQIAFTVIRSSQHFAELLLKSDKNTWTHQRRKRREVERQKKEGNIENMFATVPLSEIVQAPCKDSNTKGNLSINVSPEKSNSDLKGNNTSENVYICTEREAVAKDSSIDNQTASQKNIKKGSISDNIFSEVISLELESQSDSNSKESDSGTVSTVDSKCTSDSSLLQNSKRKGDFSSEGSFACKIAKLDISEKTESLGAKQHSNMSYEDDKNMFGIKSETAYEPCRTDTQNVSLEDHKINVPQNISSDNNSVKLESQSKLLGSSSDVVHGQNSSSSSIENICSSKDHSGEISSDISEIRAEGLVLYCHLQFIRGKSKVYVKMNCPATADRNTMYQVFQLIKNKINGF